jgi:hypothetical protein
MHLIIHFTKSIILLSHFTKNIYFLSLFLILSIYLPQQLYIISSFKVLLYLETHNQTRNAMVESKKIRDARREAYITARDARMHELCIFRCILRVCVCTYTALNHVRTIA